VFEALKGIPHAKIISYAMVLFILVVAPMWYVFQFERHLFEATELFKLIAIALAVSVPITVINSGVYGYLRVLKGLSPDLPLDVAPIPPDAKTADGQKYEDLGSGALNTLTILYVPIILTFFISLTFRQAVFISIGVQAILFVGLYKRIRKAYAAFAYRENMRRQMEIFTTGLQKVQTEKVPRT
jgi:hypothetical protein